MVEEVTTSLQVLGKGFRISERSEEFQLLVPASQQALGEAEAHLVQHDWGEILRPLYRLEDDARRKQFCLGVAATAVTVVFVEASKDRHNRRSVVVVAATTLINWEQVDLVWVVSRTAALARRFVRTLATTLEGAPERLQNQLKRGTFLPRRDFDLSQEKPDTEYDWTPICREIRRWRGITGVATRHLIGLGGNVLYGTKEELKGLTVAGLLEPAGTEITPLTSDLTIWVNPEPVVQPQQPGREPILRIEETLREIRDEQRELRAQNARLERQHQETHSLITSFYRLAQSWYNLWTGKGR